MNSFSKNSEWGHSIKINIGVIDIPKLHHFDNNFKSVYSVIANDDAYDQLFE